MLPLEGRDRDRINDEKSCDTALKPESTTEVSENIVHVCFSLLHRCGTSNLSHLLPADCQGNKASCLLCTKHGHAQ